MTVRELSPIVKALADLRRIQQNKPIRDDLELGDYIWWEGTPEKSDYWSYVNSGENRNLIPEKSLDELCDSLRGEDLNLSNEEILLKHFNSTPSGFYLDFESAHIKSNPIIYKTYDRKKCKWESFIRLEDHEEFVNKIAMYIVISTFREEGKVYHQNQEISALEYNTLSSTSRQFCTLKINTVQKIKEKTVSDEIGGIINDL